MPYSQDLALRVRALLGALEVTERRMFGGIAFMVGGNMACGVLGEDLVVRLDPAESDEALAEPGVRPMDFTGRPMRGWLYVASSHLSADADLNRWVSGSLAHATSLPRK